ncbi:hypothetical protein RMSM_05711 [Rhodopirellula maiorica SM1]|uniref:Uncharacterized protein n=1 Tax=Rhodopirellula maiorica SM1 TaxID=1265738 RepID=M5RDA6_9BACT|nr:hypothetical protein RMSM_05711 [Rhodopirellula maiorica SM1]
MYNVVVLRPNHVSVTVADDVVVVINMCTTDGRNDAVGASVNHIVVLNSLNVTMRIPDHVVVMIDVRLNDSTVAM